MLKIKDMMMFCIVGIYTFTSQWALYVTGCKSKEIKTFLALCNGSNLTLIISYNNCKFDLSKNLTTLHYSLN